VTGIVARPIGRAALRLVRLTRRLPNRGGRSVLPMPGSEPPTIASSASGLARTVRIEFRRPDRTATTSPHGGSQSHVRSCQSASWGAGYPGSTGDWLLCLLPLRTPVLQPQRRPRILLACEGAIHNW